MRVSVRGLWIQWFRMVAALMLLIVGHGCGSSGGGANDDASVSGRTTGTVIEDQAIEMKALRRIAKDEALNEGTHINITSYNTIVLVTGEAPTESLRRQAIGIVRSVEKVSKVYDEIAIAGPSAITARTSDTILTGKVKAQLFGSKQVQATRIKVVTERGVVYLMGIVPRAEADAAAEIARRVGGVQKVVKLFEYTD
jgi:osmotically-inducible protein OsmY